MNEEALKEVLDNPLPPQISEEVEAATQPQRNSTSGADAASWMSALTAESLYKGRQHRKRKSKGSNRKKSNTKSRKAQRKARKRQR